MIHDIFLNQGVKHYTTLPFFFSWWKLGRKKIGSV